MKKGNGKRANKLLSQLKQFYKMRDEGHDAMFLGEDFVIVDRPRFERDVSEVVETLFNMVRQHCHTEEDKIFSEGIDLHTQAIYILAKHAKVVVVKQDGGRIVAQLPKGGA